MVDVASQEATPGTALAEVGNNLYSAGNFFVVFTRLRGCPIHAHYCTLTRYIGQRTLCTLPR